MSEQDDEDSSFKQQRNNRLPEERAESEIQKDFGHQRNTIRSKSSRRKDGKLQKHKKGNEKHKTSSQLKGKRLKKRNRDKSWTATQQHDDIDEERFPHAKKSRSVRKEHRCSHCNKQFTKHHVLLRHVYTHTGERPHMCKLCGKGFTEVRHLRHHKAVVHEGLRPHMCDACGKTFTATQHLRQHKRAVHDKLKPHQCEYCHNWFSESSNLLRHRRTVHEGWKPYQCEECGKGFTANQTLKWHKRCVHEGERPFQCEFCGKGFSTPRDLKHHRYLHTGEKPHRCDVCGKRFTQPGNLKIHKRGVHHGQWMKEDCSRLTVSQEDDPDPVAFTEQHYQLNTEEAVSDELVSPEHNFIMQRKGEQKPHNSDSQQVHSLQDSQFKDDRQNIGASDKVNLASVDRLVYGDDYAKYLCRNFDDLNQYNVISQSGVEFPEPQKKEVLTCIDGKSVSQPNFISQLGMELSEQQKKEILTYVEGNNMNEQCFISHFGIDLSQQQKMDISNSVEGKTDNQDNAFFHLGVELSEQRKKDILSYIEEKNVTRKSDVGDPSLRSNGTIVNNYFNMYGDPKTNSIELAVDYKDVRTISECLKNSNVYKPTLSDQYVYYAGASDLRAQKVNEIPVAKLDASEYSKEILEATFHQQKYVSESQLTSTEASLKPRQIDRLDDIKQFHHSTSETDRQALIGGVVKRRDLQETGNLMCPKLSPTFHL